MGKWVSLVTSKLIIGTISVQHDRSRNTVKVTGARFKLVALGIDGRPRAVGPD
jgi:acyl-CoA hydrolase